MKSISKSRDGVLITGSSGFIGKHLCADMRDKNQSAPETREADILDRVALKAVARQWHVNSVIHLAGYGRVVAPVSLAPVMYSTSIEGTLNVVESFDPKVLLLASTCAVYGTTDTAGAIAGETEPHPLGLYGLSRVSCEKLATSWATETGKTAIVIRFGNVIGQGCGGLIPYLVDHAIRYPEGNVPARLRGGGRIVRDYVPVAHVVSVLTLAASKCWDGVESSYFNLGTGRGKANGEVGELVTGLLSTIGYKLKISYADEPGPGESRQAILDVRSTTKTFGVEPPSEQAVREAIGLAVFDRLGLAAECARAAVAQ